MTVPTLLLLHGLGASAGVWSGVIEATAHPSRVVAPDLPGHGSASWSGDYTIGALASAVAEHCEPDESVVVVGHSLGGGVAIELASGRYRPSVEAAIGLGIKTTWSDDDVAGMAGVAERGVRWFPTRDDAVVRFQRFAGLDGEAVVESANAVVEGTDDGGNRAWRVAQDPATFAQRPLDMSSLVAAAAAPVILGAGADDPMATEAELQAFVDRPRMAPGVGHNVHVEHPAWVADLIQEVMTG